MSDDDGVRAVVVVEVVAGCFGFGRLVGDAAIGRRCVAARANCLS